MTRRILVALCTLALALPVFAASNLKDDVSRLQHADRVFRAIMQTPDKGIPQEILEHAACIAIIPGEKNFAFGFGGNYGKGMASCRHGAAWSAPVFIQIGGGSWGLQLGGQSTDVVMIFKDRNGLEHLLGNKVKIGADANAVAGPVGRHAAAATDASMHAEILTYSRSRGIFAGISLNGDVVQPDNSGNRAMYGARSWRTILAGAAAAPAAARPLLATLARYAH